MSASDTTRNSHGSFARNPRKTTTRNHSVSTSLQKLYSIASSGNWIMEKMMCSCTGGNAATLSETIYDDCDEMSMADYFDDVSVGCEVSNMRERERLSLSFGGMSSADSIHRKETFKANNKSSQYGSRRMYDDGSTVVSRRIRLDTTKEQEEESGGDAPREAPTNTSQQQQPISQQPQKQQQQECTKLQRQNFHEDISSTCADEKVTKNMQAMPLSPTTTFTTVSMSSDEFDSEGSNCYGLGHEEENEISSTVSTQVISHVLPFRKRPYGPSEDTEDDDGNPSSLSYRHLLRMKPHNYLHRHRRTGDENDDDDEDDDCNYLGELIYLEPVPFNDESELSLSSPTTIRNRALH